MYIRYGVNYIKLATFLKTVRLIVIQAFYHSYSIECSVKHLNTVGLVLNKQ